MCELCELMKEYNLIPDVCSDKIEWRNKKWIQKYFVGNVG